jgi:hypothetical protein
MIKLTKSNHDIIAFFIKSYENCTALENDLIQLEDVVLVDEIKALVPESKQYDIAFFPELLEVIIYTDSDEVNFKIRAIEVEKA